MNENHSYRKFKQILNFDIIEPKLRTVIGNSYYKGYGVSRLFKCLLLQFIEDLSDRELERYINENNPAKWFCDFHLTEKTPDYSVFSRLRKKLGTSLISDIFATIRNKLKEKGFMNEVFTFVRCLTFNFKS